METSRYSRSDPAEYEHTGYEPAEHIEHAETGEYAVDESSENEQTEDEPSESGEHAEYVVDESSDNEHTEDDPSESAEHTDYEYSESEDGDYEFVEGHTTLHADEFKMRTAAALIKGQVKAGGLRLVQLRARSGQVVGVAGAKVREKISHTGSTIEYGAYSATHPFHFGRRKAAKEAHEEQRKLATERRRERVGRIKSRAAAKIAKAREGKIAALEEGVY